MTLEHRSAVSEERLQVSWQYEKSFSADVPRMCVPYAHRCVQSTGSNDLTVKCDGIYLIEMSTEDLQAISRVHIPELPPINQRDQNIHVYIYDISGDVLGKCHHSFR